MMVLYLTITTASTVAQRKKQTLNALEMRKSKICRLAVGDGDTGLLAWACDKGVGVPLMGPATLS